MRVVVFGATGPTGRLILHQGVDYKDLELTAVARNPHSLDISQANLHIVRGDVYLESSIEPALAGQDAVIAVFGAGYTFKPVDLYSTGIRHIISAMQKQGVQRLVAVTSGGTNPHYDPHEGFIFGRVIKPWIGRTLYEDMRRMEALIQQSDLAWTIVRPARLINTSAVSTYRVEPGYTLDGSETSRINLADFLLKETLLPHFLRQGIAIVD